MLDRFVTCLRGENRDHGVGELARFAGVMQCWQDFCTIEIDQKGEIWQLLNLCQ
jgi:hypothetical protein